MEKITALLRKLTADDLRVWAGAKIFSRGKSYIGNVDGLSRTDDGALAAWVSGSEEYATTVGLDPDGELEYLCTCPYEYGPCKHAVAVVLAAAERMKLKRELPLLAEDDDLYLALFEDNFEDSEDDDDGDDDGDWHYAFEEPVSVKKSSTGQKKAKGALRKIFEKMNKDNLVALLVELSGRFPEFERELLEKEQLATGQVDPLVNSLLREIRSLTSEPVWSDHWKGEGSFPDYSHLLEQFRALLGKGHADPLLQLGEELWTLGNQQVEESQDGGETSSAISECLEVVLRAVPKSSLTAPNQLLWVIERKLCDEYCLLESSDKILDRGAYRAAHWGEVALSLQDRLTSMAKPASAEFSDRYQRGKLVSMLLQALERSGRREKIIPLLEKEADACLCYDKLVDALLLAGEPGKARQWCVAGFERSVAASPGVAAGLQKRLREMARAEKNHGLVAAYRADDFFERPSSAAYVELLKAAEQGAFWPPVREGVLRYLESGRRPDPDIAGQPSKLWPLPTPEVRAPRARLAQGNGPFPALGMLIDIAILEKRFDDVVALYGTLRKTKRWGLETDRTVADAVVATHPQAALDIWRFIVDSLIAQVKPKSYEEAAVYLRRMRQVFRESRRDAEWGDLLGELRREHKPKRRLLEVLDALSGKNLLG
jgi:uncharacterized Zn finger protein